MAETNKRKTWRGNFFHPQKNLFRRLKKSQGYYTDGRGVPAFTRNTQLRTRIFVNIIFINLTVYSTVEIENSYRGSDKVKLCNFDTDSFFITVAEECA